MLTALKVPRKFLPRAIIVLLLVYTMFLTIKSFSHTTISRYRAKLENSIKLKLNTFYLNFLYSTLDLDVNPQFREALETMKEEKLKDDTTGELWELDTSKLTPQLLSVHVPKYFLDKTQQAPPVQPFDPRFTLSVYLKYITLNPRELVPFHWSDWVDLSKLNKYILSSPKANCANLFDILHNKALVGDGVLTPLADYCVDDPEMPMGFKITGFTGPQSLDNREVLGKAYLYSSAPSPVRVIFLTQGSGSYDVKVKNPHTNELRYSLLKNKMVEKLIEQGEMPETLNVLETFQNAVKISPPTNKDEELKDYMIKVPQHSFNVDPNELIWSLERKERTLSKMDKDYLSSLRFSVGSTDPPKYFSEAKLPAKFNQVWLGEHYDWRFFNGLTVGKNVQVIALHRLVKNYFLFARQHGIYTWIAHGSLLSWYWNGISFPWDTDIDVQMPIYDLHKLGRRFNQTLVVENVGDVNEGFSGMGKYFVDVGSSITHREKGNGKNNIDARFIDVDTGLYIDITALALTSTPAPSRYDHLIENDLEKNLIVKASENDNGDIDHKIKNEQLQVYNCRNNHFGLYDEISPLVLTGVENQLAYVPSNFLAPLSYEYHINGLTLKFFKNYAYLKNLRLWIPESIIMDYLKRPAEFLKIYNSTATVSDDNKERSGEAKHVNEYDRVLIGQLTVDDHIKLLHHNNIFKAFYKTFPFTKFHADEMMHLSRGNFESAKDILDNYKEAYQINKPLEPDIFMTRVIRDDWDYDNEVERITQLASIYKENSQQ